jgi:hypothetical protein
VDESMRMVATVMAQWAFPLAAAPSGSDRGLGFVGARTMDTKNVGSCVPMCPPFILL